MNTMLSFAPFLALVAFLSMEVSAEVLTKHDQLIAAKAFDGFDSMSYTYTSADAKTTVEIKPPAAGCTAVNGTCDLPIATFDVDSKVEIMAVVPPAAELVTPDGMTPAKIYFQQCFSPLDTDKRKWRKINDLFEKDNSCKTGSTAPEAVTYPKEGGPVTANYTLGGKTPSAQMTIRAYVRCEEQIAKDGDDQEKVWCHVVNYQNVTSAEEPVAVYFPTEVIENRPAGLYTAVFICAFIGPILLAAFLIYERGVLANQKKK